MDPAFGRFLAKGAYHLRALVSNAATKLLPAAQDSIHMRKFLTQYLYETTCEVEGNVDKYLGAGGVVTIYTDAVYELRQVRAGPDSARGEITCGPAVGLCAVSQRRRG